MKKHIHTILTAALTAVCAHAAVPLKWTVSPSVVTATENYPMLPIPTKTGHTFAGWYSTLYGDVQVQSGDALLEDEDHTLYAHWEAIPTFVWWEIKTF